MRSPGLASAVLAAALLSAGCGATPLGVKRLGREEVFRRINSGALSTGKPSDHSLQVLAGHDLMRRFEDDPEGSLRELHGQALQDISRDSAFALAELSLVVAQDTGKKSHYLAAAVYAYVYLFHRQTQGAQEPFDPRFRLAADIYNCALSDFLRSKKGDAVLENGTHELPFGSMEIEVTRPGPPWGAEHFVRYLPAYDFVPRGLTPRNRLPGLGAPLIAVRAKPEKERSEEDDARRRLEGSEPADYLTPMAKVPVTAFLRMVRVESAEGPAKLKGTLEIHPAFHSPEVVVDGLKVPLEMDLTTPLAYAMEEPRIWKLELAGLLRDDSQGFWPGLYFTEPYVRGKIPLVFVHGTASNPARWGPMFNALRAYPVLREKFQFWFFLYTTGSPILYSAEFLRESLKRAVRDVDPEGKDEALKRMVVIGHSQGGLLTKLQAVDSGDVFLRMMQEQLKDRELSPDLQELLRRLVVFQPLPFVERAVFVCAPHGGSFLSAWWPSRLLVKLMRSPKRLAEAAVRLGQDNAEKALQKEVSLHVPTSIENMHPEHPFLKLLRELPVDPRVKSHSIIAVDGEGPPDDLDDGVVQYKSAHLPGVESEYLVRWNHSCQAHPLVILEVRRILLEHLKGSPAPPAAPSSPPGPAAAGRP